MTRGLTFDAGRIVLLITLSAVTASCGKESSYANPDKNSFRPPANIEVGFTRSIINRQAVFAAYVPKAERLTIINPVSLQETWGEQVGRGFIDAVPLAGYDGIALVGPNELRVYSEGNFKNFGLTGFSEEASWAVASDAATMVFSNQNRETAQIIRYLGNANWQEKTIQLPKDDKSTVVGVLVSQSGKYLVSVSSPSAVFNLYRAEDSASGYNTPTLACRSTPTDDMPLTIRAGLLDDSTDLALFATESNGEFKISFVEIGLAATCSEAASWPSVSTGANVNYLSKLKSGSYAAALADGRVLVISFANNQANLIKEIKTPCTAAIGVTEGGTASEGMMFVRCTGQVHAYSTSSSADYRLIHSEEFNTTHALTPAFDPALNTAYYLDNGGLGTAHSINLVTGERHSKTGIFSRGILSSSHLIQ